MRLSSVKLRLPRLSSSRKINQPVNQRDPIRSQQSNLILVRHCETEWNAQKRLQGQTDIPLNETGNAQARVLAESLKNETLHAIYASDLQRAHQTAQAIASHHALEVTTHSHLREGRYGQAEGLTMDEYHARFKEMLDTYEKLSRQEKLKMVMIPGAESRFAIATRVSAALNEVAKRHPNQAILVVTHGGVMRALLMYLSEEYATPPFIPNGSRLHLHSDGEELCLYRT